MLSRPGSRLPVLRWLRHRRAAGALLAAAAAIALAATAPVALADTRGAAGDNLTATMALSGGVTAPLSTGQLFGAGYILVPGDIETASFVVKNASKDPALLSIALNQAAATDPSLLKALTVQASPRGSSPSGSGTALVHAPTCPVLVKAVPLAAGGQVRIYVSVSLAASVTGLQHFTQSSGFNFVANLQQALPGSRPAAALRCNGVGSVTPTLDGGTPLYPLGAPTSTPSKPGHNHNHHHASGGLAYTGTNVLAILVLASALLAAGASLLLSARRRRHGGDVPYDSSQPGGTP